MLKQLFESNSWAEHYSLASIALISAQDGYIAIVHFYIALSIEVTVKLNYSLSSNSSSLQPSCISCCLVCLR
jgi:hypothetical protein